MHPYPSIKNIYKRDETGKRVLTGEWSIPEFAYLADNEWIFTEKIDGMNIRIMWDGQGHRQFGGRTDNASLPAPLVARLQDLFPVEKFAGFDGTPVCLYGEGFGGTIQNGGKYGASPDFVLFDVKIGDWWLEWGNVMAIAATFAIPHVPHITTGALDDAVLAVSDTLLSCYGEFEAEGIVARPKVTLFTRGGDRILCKIKARDFGAAAQRQAAA